MRSSGRGMEEDKPPIVILLSGEREHYVPRTWERDDW